MIVKKEHPEDIFFSWFSLEIQEIYAKNSKSPYDLSKNKSQYYTNMKMQDM